MESIKIPRIEEQKFVKVKVYHGKTIYFKGGARKFILKQQEIEGMLIPKDFPLTVERGLFLSDYSGDEIDLKGKALNKALKFLFMEKLRAKN